MRRAALWATLVLFTACGSGASPNAAITSPSPSPPASAAPSPSAGPPTAPGTCDATHRCLALVTLRGSDSVVVRDVTDINHPTTVATVPGDRAALFVSATEMSYADSRTLYRTPLSGSPKTVVAKAAISLFAWSSDGKTAAYLTGDGVHLITAGRDFKFGQPLPTSSGYGCESQICADSWDSRLAFSPDDAYVSMLVLSGPVTGFKLWTSAGKLLATPAGLAPTMSVWSGRDFYFSDTRGVEVWRDGTTSRFLSGIQWVRPKASPAGGLIVYERRDPSGLAHVYVVDTLTKKVRELKAGRSEPVFLTSRYVWYTGERLCLPADDCAITATIPTGKAYIYDLQTGKEYGSIITGVADIWPHAA
jgi:hypothetical protein